MGKGQGLFRRTWVGAFVVGMVLAFSLPSIALAANTATFKSPVPAAGSRITNSQPTISLIGYDRYGVRASGISMWVGGVRVTPKFTYNNLGKKSFRLSYAVAAPLSNGAHRVTVKVHDLRSRNSTYSWVFTTGEAVPPVTTSNAVTEYTDSATIFLTATDNGGSGVAHTYYTLDGFAGEGPFVYTDAAGHHTLVFWSVDAAGNVEAKHTVAFTVAKDMLTNAWHQETTGFCVTSGCHFSSLTVEHYQHADEAGAPLTCFTCHDSERADVVATIAARSDACERCHGNTTNHIGNHATVVPPTAVVNCIQAGCHAGNLIAIHKDAKSGTMVSCGVCHANPLHAATNDCTVCHGTSGPHAGNHAVISSESTGTATCTQAAPCHGDSVVAAHPNCATCHSPAAGGTVPTATVVAAIAAGNATCETCHGVGFFAASHGTGNPSHVVSGSCFISTCHGTDVTKMHTNDFRGTGATPPGCAACHAAGKTPSTNCTSCHADINTPHDYAAAHARVQPLMAANSTACVACHGSVIMQVLPVPTGVPTPTAFTEHVGCSCHAYFEARNKTACEGCHNGAHAPHGFVNGVSRGEGWVAASGHNTASFGTIGAKTKFDGSQGVTLLWESEIASASLNATWLVEAGFQPATRPLGITSVTVGQEGTVTTDWDFPTANVFWNSGDPAAPADAQFLSKTSVVTCQDCHTGLSAAGPHGAAQNWALDTDYPADFSMAELSKQATAFPSGIKLRSTLTTATQTYTSGMSVICSKCHDLQNYKSGTTALTVLPLISTGSVPFASNGVTYTPSWETSKTPAALRTPAWAVQGPDGQWWAQSATGTLNVAATGSSNTAHSSHHQDNADGSAQCVGCHIGVPHGWKAPRLLVNTGTYGPATGTGAHVGGDAAPYLDPNALGTSRVTQTTQLGVAPYNFNGWNKIGMMTLSAVDQHKLNAGSPLAAPTTTGAAYWSEASCQGCNEHVGEDGIRIIDPSAAAE